jgi:hypothetical protein
MVMGDGNAAVPRWRLAGLVAVLVALVAAVTVDAATRGTAGKGLRVKGLPAAGAPAAPAPSGRSTTQTLLPNLVVLPAAHVSIDTSGPGRRLRFDSTLVNRGDGPFEVVPQELARCPRGQRQVAQVVYADANGDARYTRRADRDRTAVAAGCMLFHRGHQHWHIDATASYALTRPGSTRALVSRDKVSFCLRDSNRLRRGEGAPRTYGECARGRRQGISVGWSDLYDASLDGQVLPLPPSVRDGAYCLRLRADPHDLFREVDESDNVSSVPVRLLGDRVVASSDSGCA